MAEILLAFKDVGLAIRVQEALESAGHRVSWNQNTQEITSAAFAENGPNSQPADLVMLAENNDLNLNEMVSALRQSASPPAVLLLGNEDAEKEANRFRIAYADASSEPKSLVQAAEKSVALRFAGSVNQDFALGACGLGPSDRGDGDMLRVIAAARNVDLLIVREALRWHMLEYISTTEKMAQLLEFRALKVPEIDFVNSVDGTFTVKWAVDNAKDDPSQTARTVWALASVGALTFQKEPDPRTSEKARRIFEMRKHLRYRSMRLQYGTLFDVLEISPSAPDTELLEALRTLSIRFPKVDPRQLDLGECAALAEATAQSVKKAFDVLRDVGQKTQYAISLTQRTDIAEDSWARKHEADAAKLAYAQGQQALINGDVFQALSHMAKAARFHPSHPTYEASLCWARYRSEVTKGGDRQAIAAKERLKAEEALVGRRPWAQAQVALGMLCVASGDSDSARWHLSEALECDPNLPAAAQLMSKLGRG